MIYYTLITSLFYNFLILFCSEACSGITGLAYCQMLTRDDLHTLVYVCG